jgi:hypothetical protein
MILGKFSMGIDRYGTLNNSAMAQHKRPTNKERAGVVTRMLYLGLDDHSVSEGRRKESHIAQRSTERT